MEHMAELPRLADADGVFFITMAKGDRTSIATTIQRLIDMLDAMDGDENMEEGGDAEPWLGWSEGGPQRLDPRVAHDDREEACEDEGAHDGDAGVEDIGFDAEGQCHIPGGGSVCQATDAWHATLREARP